MRSCFWSGLAALALGAAGCSTGDSTPADGPGPNADGGGGEGGCNVAVPEQRPVDGTPMPPDIRALLDQTNERLAGAMTRRDAERVRSIVCETREELGAWQGVADVAPMYEPLNLTPPDDDEMRVAYLAEIQDTFSRAAWVTTGGGTDGNALADALRTPCNLVLWYLEAAQLQGAPVARLHDAAADGLDWVLKLQRPSGMFPLPNLEDDYQQSVSRCLDGGGTPADCDAAARPLHRTAHLAYESWVASGMPEGVIEDGFFVAIAGDPGIAQIETSVCGRALLAGYAALDDERYLEAARRAGNWAAESPAVPNFSQNAASVELLMTLDAVDPDPPRDYRADALARARLGVLPGALPNGRWFDPVNARIAQHHQILRALLVLDQRAVDPALTEAVVAAHRRSSEEIREFGAAGIEDGLVAHVWASDFGYDSDDALTILVNAAFPGALREGALVYYLNR